MAHRLPVLDEELLARLALSEADLGEYLGAAYAKVPPRSFDRVRYERAIGYPWERPAGSYVLRDGVVEELGGLDGAERARATASFTAPSGTRSPLLAIGSNAAPAALARKLAHFPDPEDRAVLVQLGRLRDFDVGPAAHLAIYGSLPATLFASPGTEVESAILWVTPRQFEQLAWSEMSYGLCLLRAEFIAEGEGGVLDAVVAFVSRFGTLEVDGAPAALAAVPARGRTAPAFGQERLLDVAAGLVLGANATAEDLVRAIHEDPGATIELIAERLRPLGIQLEPAAGARLA